MFSRPCPICGFNEGKFEKVINFSKFDDNPLPDKYQISFCDGCGFAFADMTSSQEDFNEYYQSLNMYADNSKVKSHEKTNPQNDYQELVNKDLLALYDDNSLGFGLDYNSCILDVGCGGGEHLLTLKEKGFSNLFGLDPSKDSIEKLKGYGINGILNNIFDMPQDSYRQKFDLIICTAVLEHIYDLKGAVHSISQYLKNEGIILITVPDAKRFEYYKNPIARQFNQEHINYFTVTSLNNLLMTNGFSIEKSVSFDYDNDGVLLGIYRKTNNSNYKIVKDEIAENSIRKFFINTEQEEQDCKKKVDSINKGDNKTVIWGTGQKLMQLLPYVEDLTEKVLFFADSNSAKQGKRLNGVPVYSPEKVKELPSDVDIYICSMQNASDIRNQLRAMGITNNVYEL